MSAFGLLAFFFVVDRVLKFLAPTETSGAWLTYVRSVNTAGPFSLVIPAAVLVVLATMALMLLVGIGWHAFRRDNHSAVLAVVLMLAGGVSNLFDRLTVAGVVDVFTLSGIGTFNLADIYLGIGLLMLGTGSIAWPKVVARGKS